MSSVLTIEEAARLLQVTKRTLYKWVRAGQIPATQIAGRRGVWRISRAALEAALAGGSGGKPEDVKPT